MKRLLIAISLSALLVPASASAAARGVYPKWTVVPPTVPGGVTTTGTIKFGVKGLPDATYTVVKDQFDETEVELLTGATGGDWLTSATPFGGVFGPSGPSSTIQYVKVNQNALSDTNRSVTTITFKSAFPAGLLGIAVGDLDVDKVLIQARNSRGALLTGTHLRGLARTVPFNFCAVATSIPTNCAGDTNKPTWTPTSTGGTVAGDEETSDGSAGWLRPDQAVKSITLTFSVINGLSIGDHSYRIWVAALRPLPPKPKPKPRPRPIFTG